MILKMVMWWVRRGRKVIVTVATMEGVKMVLVVGEEGQGR